MIDRLHANPEAFPEPVLTTSVSELFTRPALAVQRLPVLAKTETISQLERHSDQITTVQNALNGYIPKSALNQAHPESDESIVETAGFYRTITELLSAEDTRRLALYLPFECLPAANSQDTQPGLRNSVRDFRTAYLDNWHQLLHRQDVRANFVDGDVLEPELRSDDLPRTVKAAHLAPGLIDKGYVTENYVWQLANETADTLLRQSLSEALAAWGGTGYARPDNAPDNTISPRRAQWLREHQASTRRQKAANQIGHTLVSLQTGIDSFLDSAKVSDRSDRMTLAEGIYTALANQPAENKVMMDLHRGWVNDIDKLWDTHSPAELIHLESIYRRLCRLGIVAEAALLARGISMPDLAAPFSDHLPHINRHTERLKSVCSAIEADSELSGYIYPIVLVGGSRLKGYGQADSDIDTSIFVRPGISETERTQIQQRLQSVTAALGGDYEPMEFWLSALPDESLSIRSDVQPDIHTADAYWTHLLFNSAWIGNPESIADLQRKLLPGYFEDTPVKNGFRPRRLYLERIEQDVLQYRLMHKGYARHYSAAAREAWTHSPAIDGQSVFWDPEFRRLATKLFVRHVFLPRLP